MKTLNVKARSYHQIQAHLLRSLCLWVGGLSFVGCDPTMEEMDEPEERPTCQLRLQVFPPSAQEAQTTTLLIFDPSGKCLKNITLSAHERTAEYTLPQGQYRLAALGETDYYHLPTTWNAESEVSLAEGLLPRRPLLMGQADVTLSSTTASAYLPLLPVTANLSLQIEHVPEEAQSVQVTLDRLYSQVTLAGDYLQPTTLTVPCRREDLTWRADSLSLFPAQGDHTVLTLSVTLPQEEQHYGYNLPLRLEAGHNYQVQLDLNSTEGLSPLIDDQDLTQTSTTDTLTLSTLPTTVPYLWHGHLLYYLGKVSDREAHALLLSLNEWEEVPSAHSETDPTASLLLSNRYVEADADLGTLSGWQVPTQEEATLLRSWYADDNVFMLNELLDSQDMPTLQVTDSKGRPLRYLCNGGTHTYSLSSQATALSKAGAKTTYRLRLVKRVCLILER